jgi:hypothetical protein
MAIFAVNIDGNLLKTHLSENRLFTNILEQSLRRYLLIPGKNNRAFRDSSPTLFPVSFALLNHSLFRILPSSESFPLPYYSLFRIVLTPYSSLFRILPSSVFFPLRYSSLFGILPYSVSFSLQYSSLFRVFPSSVFLLFGILRSTESFRLPYPFLF